MAPDTSETQPLYLSMRQTELALRIRRLGPREVIEAALRQLADIQVGAEWVYVQIPEEDLGLFLSCNCQEIVEEQLRYLPLALEE